MEPSREQIFDKTYFGINIYSYVLRQYYPSETVLSLSGKDCKPAKNPFNNNKETLNISIIDGIAYHKDLENAIPDGDALIFAALHFNKEGVELMREIDRALNLNIVVQNPFYNLPKIKIETIPEKVEIAKVSFFKHPIKNVWPEKEVNLKYVYNLIRRELYEQQTLKLRSITDSKEARNYKSQNFDYVTFSGTFSKRSDEYLISHSGLLTIDFDHIPNLNKLKKILLEDEYFETVLLFKSPSGDGLKWIIPIDLKQGSHKDNFLAITNYIRLTYNVEVDASGKDISRACFLPHDREAYINPKYL